MKFIRFIAEGHPGVVEVYDHGLRYIRWHGMGANIEALRETSVVRIAAEAAIAKQEEFDR